MLQQESRSQKGIEMAGVTAEDVVACIEMILGRTPDQKLVDYHLGLGFANRFELGRYMVNVEEFTHRHVREQSIFLGDRVLSYTHRGEPIFLVPTDIDLTPGIIRHGAFEPHVEKVISRLVQTGDVAIDIGTNVGFHTLNIGKAVGNEGKVYAFEVNPEVFRLMKATLVLNGLTIFLGTGRINVYNLGVADKRGKFTMAMAASHFGSGHILNTTATHRDVDYTIHTEVECASLDDVLGEQIDRLDFLHMDIEGSEPLALYGAERLINRSENLKIVMEWSIPMMSARASIPDLAGWLASKSFNFWLIERSGNLVSLTQDALLSLPHSDVVVARQSPL